MGLVWEKSFWVFFILTVLIGGGAAFATGRALALKWRPFHEAIVYACLLGLVDRFLHWGLFLDRPLDVYKGNILSLQFYLVDTLVLLAICIMAYRLTQAHSMTKQYPWMYERAGPFSWKKKQTGN